MDPFTLLGIDHGADDAAIKRAYAQRLRKTRPDDDPEGFQRLNEAYRAALAHSKAGNGRPARGHGPAWNRPVPVRVTTANPGVPAVPVAANVPRPLREPRVHVVPLDPQHDAPRSRPPSFDPAAFIAEFREYCARDNAHALSRWLNQHPAFWNLPTKHAAGRLLLRALFEQPERMNEACFAATSDFFHFDDTLAGIDPLLLRRVRNRGTIAWLVRGENHAELARRVYGTKTRAGVQWVRAAIKTTSGPFRWWRDLPHALRPGKFVQHIARVLLCLCDGNLADLPPPIDIDHARYWIEAAGPNLGKPKLMLYLARSVAAVVLMPLILTTIGVVVGYFAEAPHFFKASAEFGGVMVVIMLLIVAIIWAFVGGKLLDQKLDRLAASSKRLRIAMFSATPILCAGALLLACTGSPVLGAIIAIVTMFLALWRNGAKHGGRGGTVVERLQVYGMFILVAGALSGMGPLVDEPAKSSRIGQLLPTFIILAIALGIWAWDWRKRGFLKPRV